MSLHLGGRLSSVYSRLLKFKTGDPWRQTGKQCLGRYLSKTAYQDSTLTWAQENPRLAQECLNPPLSIKTTRSLPENIMESFEAYLDWRGWKFPKEMDDGSLGSNFRGPKEKAKALVSHLLSAPLTLASQSKYIIQDCTTNKMKTGGIEFNWCCVGARAEASIPLMYWKEYLIYTRASLLCEDWISNPSNKRLEISMDFIGPDLPPKLSEQNVLIPNENIENNDSYASSLSLRGCHRGFFHESPAKEKINSWDAYVFFNPGFGHPNLRKSWEPTLDLILGREQETANTPRALLLTAHSEHDMDRDATILRNDYGLKDIVYHENPFASRIAYEDPFEKNHFVRPNHYIATVFI